MRIYDALSSPIIPIRLHTLWRRILGVLESLKQFLNILLVFLIPMNIDMYVMMIVQVMSG